MIDWVGIMLYAVLGALIAGIFGAVIFYFVSIKKYNIKVRIRDVVDGRTIIIDDVAKEITDKDGVTYWKFLKTKDNERRLRPPNKDELKAVDIDRTGKKIVEVYKTGMGQYEYLQDKAESKNFEPFTTEDQMILTANHQKSLQRRGKSLTELLINLAPLISISLVVIVLVVFGGSLYEGLAKPNLEMAKHQESWMNEQTKQMQILRDIELGVQSISGESHGEAPN